MKAEKYYLVKGLTELTTENYHQHLPIDAVAFSYEDKNLGYTDPGGIIIVSSDKRTFHIDTMNYRNFDNAAPWTKKQLLEVLPILQECKFENNIDDKKPGWSYLQDYGTPFKWSYIYEKKEACCLIKDELKDELLHYIRENSKEIYSYRPIIWFTEIVNLLYRLEDGCSYIYDFDGNLRLDKCINPHLTEYTVKEDTYAINPMAFDRKEKIEKITLPNTLKVIKSNAFRNCRKLSSINIPHSVERIEDQVFYCCKSLQHFNLPNKIDLGMGVFMWCSNLNSVILPDDMQVIPEATFFCCSNMQHITFPQNLLSIDTRAFEDCRNLTKLTLPDSVTNIGASAFSLCGLNEIILPSNLTVIGYRCFYRCPNLKRITIPSHVISIGCEAFADCYSLRSITFQGKPVPHLDRILADIPNLQEINVPLQYKPLYLEALQDFTPLLCFTPDSPK